MAIFLAALSYGPNVENHKPVAFYDENPVSALESADYHASADGQFDDQTEADQDVSDEPLDTDGDGLTSGIVSQIPSWGSQTPSSSWVAMSRAPGFARSSLARSVAILR